MKNLKKVIASAGATAGAAAMVLGATLPASAATHAPVRFERISGFLAGPRALASAPVVPLRLQGTVNTVGHINLGGNGHISRIPTFRGTLTVDHGTSSPPARLDFRTCRETQTIDTSYRVLGNESTGVFWHSTGHGRAVVVFTAIAPRYSHGALRGRCDFRPSAKPHDAEIFFNAEGPLSLR